MSRIIDVTGQTFTRLTALRLAETRTTPSGHRVTYWLCQCVCGTEVEVASQNLRMGKVRSCGCLNADATRARGYQYANRRFGRLVALRRGPTLHDGATTWVCRCDCGTERQVRTQLLTIGDALSCGCLRDLTAAHRAWVGDAVTYLAMHNRIKRFRGRAKDYTCVDCQDRARDWSYNGGDPNEKHEFVNGSTLAFSTDHNRYSPRCPKCHSRFDRERRKVGAA